MKDLGSTIPTDNEGERRLKAHGEKILAEDSSGDGRKALEIFEKYHFQGNPGAPLELLAGKYAYMRQKDLLRILPPETLERFASRSSNIDYSRARQWIDKVAYLQKALDKGVAEKKIDTSVVDRVTRDLALLELESIFRFLETEHDLKVDIDRVKAGGNW